MKNIAVIVLSAAALCALADEEYVSPITGKPVPKDGKYTVEQIKERDERVLRKTGGFGETTARGTSVAVVDAREKPAGAAIQFKDVFGSLSKTNVEIERSPLKAGESAFEKARSIIAAGKTGYVIVIIDNGTDGGVAVYPEERIAIVNAGIYAVADDPLKTETRIHKEIWRALGFVAGIGYAPFKNDVLQSVHSAQELDDLTYQVMQPMNFQKMYSDLGKFGISRARRVPYHIAVQEGWASPPTNDVQKAIWKRVHAIPDKPIKIEFDPKRDKGK
jgi:hypothetical protein